MDVCLGRTSMNMTFSESHSGSKNVGFMSECLDRFGPQRTTAVMCDGLFEAQRHKKKPDRNQSMKAGRNGPLYFSWAINNSGYSRPDRTEPD